MHVRQAHVSRMFRLNHNRYKSTILQSDKLGWGAGGVQEII